MLKHRTKISKEVPMLVGALLLLMALLLHNCPSISVHTELTTNKSNWGMIYSQYSQVPNKHTPHLLISHFYDQPTLLLFKEMKLITDFSFYILFFSAIHTHFSRQNIMLMYRFTFMLYKILV